MKDFTLNKEQRKAVEYSEGPLLIIAGAGTGKTAVITKKIIHLIEKKGVLPEEILALTFADKAAGEMEERVDENLAGGYMDLHISTFHTFCQRILELYGIHIGLPNRFRLLSETDAWILMGKNIHDLGLDYYRPIGNPASHIYSLLKHFSKCKDELISPEEYLKYAEELNADKDAIQQDERHRLSELAQAYHAYNQLLLDNNSLDFGDLIYYTVKLLEKRPAVLDQIQRRFTHILVDEFQDVNYAQYELVQKLTGSESNLTVVGDDDQSIYAFRGASVSNIMRFKEDYPNAKEVVLTKNYRSAQKILDLAYTSIQHNNPDRLEEKLNINKKLISGIENQDAQISHSHFETIDTEVEGVIERILKLKKHDPDLSWDDVAILVRANAHADPFLGALERARIPYEFISSVGLYRQPVVLDCFSFLRILESHYDNLSIYRILRLPFFEMSEQDVQLFTHMAKKKSITYYEALKRAREFGISQLGVKVCEKIINFLHNGLQRSAYEKPTVILYHFLDNSGYLSYLAHEEQKGNSDVMRQIYQLKQFFDLVSSYETATAGARVKDFVEHFEQVLLSGDQGKMYQPEDTPDSVNIITIHGSKGLEFEHVFLVNLVDQRFPTRRRGELIPLPDALVKEHLPEGDFHLQEERRLFYVGLTRAKRGLYLTSADSYGSKQKKKISRFLHEIKDELVTIEEKNVHAVDTPIISEPVCAQANGEQNTSLFELPKVFSFSQLRAFDYCPYQYKLANLLKIPMKGSPYFSYGNSIHKTLQTFYEKIQELNRVSQGSLFDLPQKKSEVMEIAVPTQEELLSYFEEAWISDWYNSKRQREEYYEKGKSVLKTFYKEHEGQWTVPAGIESWFKVKVGEYLVHGRIDRFDVQGDGSLNIIDYKTGKGKEKLSTADKRQLLLYQLAAETLPEYRNIGPVGALTFYYLDDNLKSEFVGKPKDIEKLKEWIGQTIDKIYAKDFSNLTKEDMCGRCDFCNMGLV
ncbi:MAG: UvrD-helicase domain-containing protein [Candidatus Magasanikbacteria bacterium]